jgi:uncharacterized protein
MSHVIAALASGVVFAVGLGLAGMTQPAKVFGFLNLFGNWDPSLAFVMMGAIAVHAIAIRLAAGRPAPILAERFAAPSRAGVDGKLVGGAALFGVGWGVAGYCPGPAVASVASLELAPLAVVAAMIAGMLLHDAFLDAASRRHATASPAAEPAAAAATDG